MFMKKDEVIYVLQKMMKNKQEVCSRKYNYTFEPFEDEELKKFLIEQNKRKISRLVTEINALSKAIYYLTNSEIEDNEDEV